MINNIKQKLQQIMNAVLLFFKHLFSNSSVASSRRFITVIASFVMIFIALVDTLTSHHPTQFVYDGLMYVVLGGLGLLTTEKFAPKKDQAPVDLENIQDIKTK